MLPGDSFIVVCMTVQDAYAAVCSAELIRSFASPSVLGGAL